MNTLNTEQIAHICHEANRILQGILGEQTSEYCDYEAGNIKESAICGVQNIALGKVTKPEDSHVSWLAFKDDDGWVYGPVKDAEKKTHPCMVPYDQLPEEQKIKDHLYFAIVKSLLPFWCE